MRLAVLVLLAALVSGCNPQSDRDQERLCRLAVTGLLGLEAAVVVEDQRVVSSAPGATTIRVDYRAELNEGPAQRGFVECTFSSGADHLRLAALRTADGLLSEPRVFMLDRFWLQSAEALVSDPGPMPGAATAPRLPAGSGYGIQQIVNAIPGAAVYGLLAAAYSMIYGLVGRINLAFGAFAAIGGSAALLPMLAGQGWPVPLMLACAILAAVSSAAFHGIATGRLVFTRLQGATGQQTLVATIGLALFLDEYVRLTQGSSVRWAVPVLDDPFVLARDPSFTVTITPIALLVSLASVATAGALLAVMRWTRFGREWRAFSDDPGAAALCGVGRTEVFATTFAIACALAGLSGCITVLFYGDLGLAYATTLGIKALTAAVLGGIGSVAGAFLGGLFIGLVESGWSAAFPIEYRDLVLFCILVACLIWRPGGFMGYRDLTPRRM